MIDDATMQRLLGADIDELEGRGESEIARLVRERATVRSIAHRILASMREADAAIADIAAARSGSPAVVRVDSLATSHGSKATTQPPHPSALSGLVEVGRRRSRTATGRRVRPALSLAMTAIALIVIAGPDPVVTPAPAPTDHEPMTASLNVSSSRSFAVFPTDNPDIAIVWLFDEEER